MRLLLVSTFLIGIAATHSQHSLLADEPRVIDVWPARAPGVAADAVLENKSEQNDRIGTRVTSVSKPTSSLSGSPPVDEAPWVVPLPASDYPGWQTFRFSVSG